VDAKSRSTCGELCGRRNCVVLAPRRWRQVPAVLQRRIRDDGGKRALVHRGERL